MISSSTDSTLRPAERAAGGETFHYVPCLNDDAGWIAALAGLAEQHMGGWDTRSPTDAPALAGQRERALALGATN